MNGRLYDPRIGRFVSGDPLGQDWRNPQTLNRYSYVKNNPLKYVDSSGFDPDCAEDACDSGDPDDGGPEPGNSHNRQDSQDNGGPSDSGDDNRRDDGLEIRRQDPILVEAQRPPRPSLDAWLNIRSMIDDFIREFQRPCDAAVETQVSFGAGATLGGGPPPTFVFPSVFGSGSGSLGFTSRGRLFIQGTAVISGGFGAYGGANAQFGVTRAPPISGGPSGSSGIQVDVNVGAGRSYGGSVQFGDDGSTAVNVPRGGWGAVMQFAIGRYWSGTLASPAFRCRG